MEKLSVLVPMPRANLVRYHGVLAPAAKWRPHVVPKPDEEGRVCGQRPPGGPVPSRRVPWAMLIRRVFLDDVLRCPTCKGGRRLLGEVTDPAAIAAILDLLVDEDAEGQVPVRGPPQARLPGPA